MKTLLISLALTFSCADVEKSKQGRLVDAYPEDGSTEIYLDATFTLVFTEPYILDSLTSQAEDGACDQSFSVALSADDFENCIGGTITATSDGSERRAIFTPLKNLPPETELKLKLTGDIKFKELENLNEVTLSFKTGTEITPEEANLVREN
jgi:hypothetical protein